MDDSRLHSEFRNIILLLNLARDINSKFRVSDGGNQTTSYTLEPNQRTKFSVLLAIAQLLMRNFEVVTTAFVSNDRWVPTSGVCAMVEQSDGVDWHIEGLENISGFATIENSDHSSSGQSAGCMIVPRGSSHWQHLTSQPWHGVTLV